MTRRPSPTHRFHKILRLAAALIVVGVSAVVVGTPPASAATGPALTATISWPDYTGSGVSPAVVPGDSATMEVTVTNTGDTASMVNQEMGYTAPYGAQFQGATQAAYPWTGLTCSTSIYPPASVCDLPSIPAGGSFTLDLSFSFHQAPFPDTNGNPVATGAPLTFGVSLDYAVPNGHCTHTTVDPTDNICTFTTSLPLAPSAVLAPTNTVTPAGTAAPGDTQTWTLHLANSGDAPSQGWDLTAMIPTGITSIDGITPSNQNCGYGGCTGVSTDGMAVGSPAGHCQLGSNNNGFLVSCSDNGVAIAAGGSFDISFTVKLPNPTAADSNGNAATSVTMDWNLDTYSTVSPSTAGSNCTSPNSDDWPLIGCSTEVNVALWPNAQQNVAAPVPSVNPVRPGGTVTWTVSVTNSSSHTPLPADQRTIWVQLDATVLTLSPGSVTGGWTCAAQTIAGLFACTLPDGGVALAPSGADSFKISTPVSSSTTDTSTWLGVWPNRNVVTPPAGGTVTCGPTIAPSVRPLIAGAASPMGTPLPGTQACGPITTITIGDPPPPPVADLTTTKTSSASSVEPGDGFDWTIGVSNSGQGDDHGVVITDVLPVGTTATSAPAGCTLTGQTLSCDIGDLAAGGTVTRTVHVTADDPVPAAVVSAGQVVNTVHVADSNGNCAAQSTDPGCAATSTVRITPAPPSTTSTTSTTSTSSTTSSVPPTTPVTSSPTPTSPPVTAPPAPAPSGGLPVTGAATGTLWLISALLFGTGCVLVAASRRRGAVR